MRHNFRLMIFLILCLSSVPLLGLPQNEWRLFEETNIAGRVSGSIRKGYIFKTRSGNIYEVTDYVYLYEYEYNPNVIVLTDGSVYKLIIDGFDEPLLCEYLNHPPTGSATPSTPNQQQEPPLSPDVIESYIVSDFDGLDSGNFYKLANGQIWEQTEYWIWVWVWVNPQVLIWNKNGIYSMKVEQIDHPVMVRRIK